MIEVNLRPDGKSKRRSRGAARRGFAMPRFSGAPSDPWVLAAGGLALLALLTFGWFHFAVAGEADELEFRIEAAQDDSARFADVIERAERLQARRDSIAARVSVIQEIDGARYVWPHLMDEVGRALPDYTWITRFLQVSPPPELNFRVHGQAATIFALTIFLENLEASPFIRNARLISADQTVISLGSGSERLVYNFVVEASHQEPPPEVLEREPLFGPSVAIPGAGGPATAPDDPQGGPAAEVADGAGDPDMPASGGEG